jgi:predicted GIY-YIG superfamily endonuclease
MTSEWHLYLLLSSDGKRTYVGVTMDLKRRLEQHNGVHPGGAKNTRGGRPWSLLHSRGGFPNRSAAQSAEATLKRLIGDKRVDYFES